MTGPNDYQELVARLREERARLNHARENYETITQSRFHALRMLWFSLKQLAGRISPDDAYAVWSKGSSICVPPGRIAKADSARFAQSERALVEAWNARIAEKPDQPPLVTIVIPVFNHLSVTVRCLQSLATSWFESLAVQFIVVDDGSTDGTISLLAKLNGVDVIRNGRNDGFVRACNRGAQLVNGKYICFLNNDTVVRDGWLDHLVNTLEGDESIGVVGAKLVYPDDRLQEAGAIIWRDATGWNVGRNGDPDDPRYNFVRDVDYVSGAALLVRRNVFCEAGGFSDEFSPAYYEDVDLCFKVRALGSRVVYQPRAVVVHYESVTSGDERTGTKRYQEINRSKFREKWSAELEQHLPNGHENVVAASLGHKKSLTILLIDSYVPLHDQEAGSRRIFYIIKLLRNAGHSVIFLPDNFAPVQPYTNELQEIGVQVLYHLDGGQTAQEALEHVLPAIDAAWISRPDLYQKYAPVVRRNRNARLIYDTVDLHFVRKRREAELFDTADDEWREWERVESQAARSADATVVVTAEEKVTLEEYGVDNIFVVPTIHEPAKMPRRRFDETSGLLFVANYNHPPNGDAAHWLCESVMPLVWTELSDVRLTLAGANPDDRLRARHSERISVTGYVPDLASWFRRTRIFVAPLRFGAGMKGKIGQALEYRLPIVTTPVGAEGFGLKDGQNASIVSPDAKAFAAAIVSLYRDRDRWQRFSDESAAVLARFTPLAIQPVLQSIFLSPNRAGTTIRASSP